MLIDFKINLFIKQNLQIEVKRSIHFSRKLYANKIVLNEVIDEGYYLNT